MIHSLVSWILAPVERSIMVSAPQMVDHCSFSTSCKHESTAAVSSILAEATVYIYVTCTFDVQGFGSSHGGSLQRLHLLQRVEESVSAIGKPETRTSICHIALFACTAKWYWQITCKLEFSSFCSISQQLQSARYWLKEAALSNIT